MIRNSKHHSNSQSGNAMIYVLIVVALFAAINFVLSNQNNSNEMDTLSTERVTIYATQIQQTGYQVKQVLDQMVIGGTFVEDFDFILPSDANFNTGSNSDHTKKVYHPLGGGLVHPKIPFEAINEVSTPPDAGFYLGYFNNVSWTDTADFEVILTAYQINQQVCEKINADITGNTTIPAFSDVADYLVDVSNHSGSNVTFDETVCAECEGYNALCVSNADASEFSYYNILVAQ